MITKLLDETYWDYKDEMKRFLSESSLFVTEDPVFHFPCTKEEIKSFVFDFIHWQGGFGYNKTAPSNFNEIYHLTFQSLEIIKKELNDKVQDLFVRQRLDGTNLSVRTNAFPRPRSGSFAILLWTLMPENAESLAKINQTIQKLNDAKNLQVLIDKYFELKRDQNDS